MVHEININGHRLTQMQCEIVLDSLRFNEPDEPDDQREHLLSLFDDPMSSEPSTTSDRIAQFFTYLAVVALMGVVILGVVVFLRGIGL